MDRTVAVVLTLAVGGLVAFQPPANALLARHVGDFGAAFVSLVTSTTLVGLLLILAGDVGHLKGITGFKPEHALGGIAGAGIVVVSLITVRTLGASGVVAGLVSAQLIVAAVLDRLGVLGLDKSQITPLRVIGIALLIVGTILVTAR